MFFTTIKLVKLTRHIKISASILSGFVAVMIAHSAMATIVQFQTVMGDFQVNLYDKTTPKTVENFLTYVKSGAYGSSIIHRSESNFVVQGGGYKYDTKLPLITIPASASVINEPVYANKRGTIAMAKLNLQPNSATNQWFFNLVDNSAELDGKNGGFTVFGEVMGNGMAIVDAMAALPILNAGSSLSQLPLRNYTATDATNGVVITDKNLVMVLGVVVLDANQETAANLNPTKTTYKPGNSDTNNGGSSGGGSIGVFSLLLIAALSVLSRPRK